MKTSVVSVIPIKMNNERLANKNTKILRGKPLIYYIQNTLLQVSLVDRIYVYCSSKDVSKYLEKGVTFLSRPVYLDQNTTNFTQIFDEFYTLVEADVYVYAHATAPFIQKETISDCIEKVLSGNFDSAFTAVKIQDYLWKNGKAWNFDAANIPRSQDLDTIYRETSGVYVFRNEVFRKYKRRIGIKPYIKEVSYKEAVDINTLEDFQLAEKLF